MKKQRILFTAVLIALCSLLTFTLTGCFGSSAEKAEYSVTVLSPSDEPLSGITVTWSSGSVNGSAVTDADGKATASLPLGTYSVALSGITEGLDYTSVSVTSTMRKVTLNLVAMHVQYSATVIDKNGAAAKGVTVNWTSGSTFAGSAVTDATGKAVCELDYADYTVTVSNLPEGNLSGGAQTATGKTPNVRFDLKGGQTVAYSVTFKTEGGLPFKNYLLYVYSGDTLVSLGRTNDYATFLFDEAPSDYTVIPDPSKPLPDGYTVTPATLTPSLHNGEVIARSAVLTTTPSASLKYKIGDIIHDYSFTVPYEVDGVKQTYTISELLKTKDAVLINNWGVGCSWCVKEMPAMQEAYAKYGDKIEMLAVNNFNNIPDSDSTITAYYNENGYTFPMMRDSHGLASKFSLSSWPSTVIIDRYGAVARIESGAVLDSEVWGSMIEKYIGDDYVQSFEMGAETSDPIIVEIAKPDVVLSPDHYEKIAAAINNTAEFPAGASITWFGETQSEYAWPFVLGTEPDVSADKPVLYSSNTTKPSSFSAIYATVKVGVGKVLTFDYYAQTQSSDVLSIVWDGKIIKQISGNSNGWQTCNLISEITSGEHTLAMAYVKDGSVNTGKDNVFFKNFRFADISELTEPIDMLRAAAYGTPEENATQFPYYASVAIGEDGYYHVDLSKLQNSQYAGNDESPLLLVNLLNVTNWLNNVSIYDLVTAVDNNNGGEYLFDCNFTINGVKKDYRDDLMSYFKIAGASDVDDCVPVDKELHDLLVAFMAKVSGNTSHENEWLEACYFYSHYGSGDPVGNPIVGLTKKTALPASVGTYTADLTRIMAPLTTLIYTFTPTESAVYKIESLIPQKDSTRYQGQMWLYDDDTTAVEPLDSSAGNERLVRDGVNEHNFELYRYMAAGHKYYIEVAFTMNELGTLDFKISNVGQSASVLLPASSNTFSYKRDEDGKLTDELYLAGAVEYVKDDDGYFHAINPDGTVGDFIYFDVKYPTAVTNYSITALADQELIVPVVGVTCGYKTFDFRYMIAYFTSKDDEGNEIVTYYKNYDLSADDTENKYIDYTDIIKTEYIDKAYKSGEKEGLVKVDQRLADILNLFIETRVNQLMDNVYENALENEWLRFCWYYRPYDSANV